MLAAIVLGTALLGQSCSADGQDATAGNLSNHQREALEDELVTSPEYHEGYRRFTACLAEIGVTLIENGEEGSVIQYAMTEEDAADPKVDECYNSEFRELDIQWQVAHSEESDGAAALRTCLEKFGLPPETDNKARVEALKSAGVQLSQCD